MFAKRGSREFRALDRIAQLREHLVGRADEVDGPVGDERERLEGNHVRHLSTALMHDN
jgi:hypothetical protein